MAEINFRMNCSFNFTPISNIFIDEYMLEANPVFSLIYIFGYKNAFNNQSFTTSDIAEKFNILESDVINAWKYWHKENIIEMVQEDNVFDINFIEVKTKEQKIIEDEIISAKQDCVKTSYIYNNIEKVQYTSEELKFYEENNNNIKDLFNKYQEVFAKGLSFGEMNCLLNLYDNLKLPCDVMGFLFEYCSLKAEHCSMRYIERVAVDWHDKGIFTVEDAQDYVKKYDEYYAIRKIVGVKAINNITPEEKEMMDRWKNEYKMTMQLINKAVEKSIINIRTGDYKYLDTIMKNWYEKGIQTVEEVEEYDKEYKREQEEKKAKEQESKDNKIKVSSSKNRFVNYKQPKVDFDQIKKETRESLLKELGKTN